MKLTALEIKQQKFERSLRGYDVAEVNAFLGVIASEWEHMVSKNRELEAELQSYRDKLKHYEKVEQALHETLQTAKESADHRMSEARKEAQNTIEKSEMEANAIIREAQQQRQQIRQSILQLLDRREEIIKGIHSFLERSRQSLESFDKDEASLFQLPKEQDTKLTDISGKDNHQYHKTDQSKDEKEQSDNNSQKEDNIAANLDDIDDILNQID
jgi:cell division initiation protein